MHVFFSGIGGTGIGPLALIAHQAGFDISGSDKQDSQYIRYLKKQGVGDVHIGQTSLQIATVHAKKPIDWFVYTSALTLENPHPPELQFCAEHGIRTSKRDELLNFIIKEKNLKLVAIAGTYGKTTTTAMAVWLFKQLGVPVSYSVGAKIPFGAMGEFAPDSEYFVYEADEFDRNFLAFEPYLGTIVGVSWDHHEIFRTREDYQQAFREFISQSKHSILWQEDANYLELELDGNLTFLQSDAPHINQIKLAGQYNRLDAWLVVHTLHRLTSVPLETLVQHINTFPGLQRRMEQIAPNLYSDYAHSPDKIRGGMSVALELATHKNQAVVIVYEPLTNRRQHYTLDEYKDCFAGAAHVYWLPSYLAREDPSQRIITPEELISHLDDPVIASPAHLDNELQTAIQKHLAQGDLVVGMAGGGGKSLDEWLRQHFAT